MKPLASSLRMARIDQEAQKRFRIPGLLLMEQAGTKGFNACAQMFPEKLEHAPQLLFIAGRGNNGGDALVMAREAFLAGYSGVRFSILPGTPNESVVLHRDICRNLGIEEIPYKQLAEVLGQSGEVIFDGITGTGLSSPLGGTAAEAVQMINRTKSFVVSIDLPSGIYEEFAVQDLSVWAQFTLAMGMIKRSCVLPAGRSRCGRIICLNPGFPPELLSPEPGEGMLLDAHDARLPAISTDSYKNKRGHAAVFAGSPGYTGAARLAAQGAMSTRAGLVTLFCDPEIYPVVAPGLWESIICKSGEMTENASYTSLLCGPGWGRDPSRTEVLRKLLDTGLPGVIDADGLYALSRIGTVNLQDRMVLTPHPGEFRMLQPDEGSLTEQLKACSRRYRAWVVYKSHMTLIAGPEGTLFVAEGLNPAMGTAGSGDVLSGVIAGLLAEGLSLEDAACKGVLLHQLAGSIAAERWGWFSSHQLFGPLMECIRDSSAPDESA